MVDPVHGLRVFEVRRRRSRQTPRDRVQGRGPVRCLVADKDREKKKRRQVTVPDVSFAGVPWLGREWALFCKEFPAQFADKQRDFWVPDLESKVAFRDTAPEYARALQWAHPLVYSAARLDNVEAAL